MWDSPWVLDDEHLAEATFAELGARDVIALHEIATESKVELSALVFLLCEFLGKGEGVAIVGPRPIRAVGLATRMRFLYGLTHI